MGRPRGDFSRAVLAAFDTLARPATSHDIAAELMRCHVLGRTVARSEMALILNSIQMLIRAGELIACGSIPHKTRPLMLYRRRRDDDEAPTPGARAARQRAAVAELLAAWDAGHQG